MNLTQITSFTAQPEETNNPECEPDDGLPPANHRRHVIVAALRQIADRRGWEVVEQYHDAGISGAKGPDVIRTPADEIFPLPRAHFAEPPLQPNS